MKRKLFLIVVLLAFLGIPMAQSQETMERRTFWLGFNLDFGAVNLHMGDGLLDGIYGVTVSSAIPINKSFAVGPYATLDIFNEDPAPFAGVIAKYSFRNNSAVFVGYGLGLLEQDYYNKISLYNQLRVGLKSRRSLFLTGSYLFGEYKGATFGVGFSFGGKLKKQNN